MNASCTSQGWLTTAEGVHGANTPAVNIRRITFGLIQVLNFDKIYGSHTALFRQFFPSFCLTLTSIQEHLIRK